MKSGQEEEEMERFPWEREREEGTERVKQKRNCPSYALVASDTFTAHSWRPRKALFYPQTYLL